LVTYHKFIFNAVVKYCCKCSSVICDVISAYKHGSFNKLRQNFNKNSPDLNSVDYSVCMWRCNRWCIVTIFQTWTSWNTC